MFFASYVSSIHAIPFYSMNMGLYHFSTCSTWPRILPFLREFNIVTLQRASWGLNSLDSSDLMLMPVRVFIFHISSIFGRYYCHLYPALSLFNPLSLGQYCFRIDFGMGKPTYHLYHFWRHQLSLSCATVDAKILQSICSLWQTGTERNIANVFTDVLDFSPWSYHSTHTQVH